jgi:hypothetical protein
MTPNTDQILSLIRAILQIVGTSLMAKGVVTTADWTTYSGAILMAAPIIWGLLAHTDGAKIAAVAAMPDVEKIVVQPKAGDGVGAALADPTQPKVVST